MQKRILIVINDGTLGGISMTDESGKPQPITVTDLDSIAPEINASLIADIEQLKADHKAELEGATGQPSSGGVTKLTIMRRLQALGKWTMFKGLLAQLPEDTQDAWSLAQEIHDDDPMFITYADGIKAGLELTDEQFTALLIP